MNRALKQIIYGLFYALTLFGIIWGIYNLFFTDEASIVCCEGIDIKISAGEVRVLPLGRNTSTLVIEVENPSRDYGLRKFDYSFDIFSKFGPLIRKVYGLASLYPGEKKYLVESGLDINPNEIGTVNFTVYSPDWEEASILGEASRAETRQTKVYEEGNSKIVEGSIINLSREKARTVIVLALGFDAGEKIFSAATFELNNVQPNTLYNFKIFLPNYPYKDIKVLADILPR